MDDSSAEKHSSFDTLFHLFLVVGVVPNVTHSEPSFICYRFHYTFVKTNARESDPNKNGEKAKRKAPHLGGVTETEFPVLFIVSQTWLTPCQTREEDEEAGAGEGFQPIIYM